MIQILCDLCCEPIKNQEKAIRHFKVKECKPMWGIFCEWQDIVAHDECVKAIAAAARERSDNGET